MSFSPTAADIAAAAAAAADIAVAKRNACLETVCRLYEEYGDDEYMLSRIYAHVHSFLPAALASEHAHHERQRNLRNYLLEEQYVFVETFLRTEGYLYLPQTGRFCECTGSEYRVVHEDDLVHKILSTISRERTLLPWKQKTKSILLRRIKQERHLCASTPRAATVQSVLAMLSPDFFPSPAYATYVLASLGDMLLKTPSDAVYIVTPKTKLCLDALDAIVSPATGPLHLRYVTRYHASHSFAACRLLKLAAGHRSTEHWTRCMQQHGLAVVCVAAFLSRVHGSADQFAATCRCPALHPIAALTHTTRDQLMDRFVRLSVWITAPSIYRHAMDDRHAGLVPGTNGVLSGTNGVLSGTNGVLSGTNGLLSGTNGLLLSAVPWKRVCAAWKQFLSDTGLPSVVPKAVLKRRFKAAYRYDESTDSFEGIELEEPMADTTVAATATTTAAVAAAAEEH